MFETIDSFKKRLEWRTKLKYLKKINVRLDYSVKILPFKPYPYEGGYWGISIYPWQNFSLFEEKAKRLKFFMALNKFCTSRREYKKENMAVVKALYKLHNNDK